MNKYERGFQILVEFFDYIPDEDKILVDKKLRTLGL